MTLNRKKKNILTLVILLLLVVGASLAVIVINTKEKQKEEPNLSDSETEKHSLTLCSYDAKDIVKITLKNSDFSGTIVRSYTEGEEKKAVFAIEGREDFPVNVEKATYLFSDILLEASEFVTDKEELSEFGLDKPSITAEITNAVGETEIIAIGRRSGITDKAGFYINVNGSSEVFLAKTSMYVRLSYTEEDFIAIDTPKTDIAKVTKYVLEKSDGTVTISRTPEESVSLFGSAYSNFVLSDSEGKVFCDTDKMLEYFADYLSGTAVERAIDYKAENFDKYGLDKPAKTIRLYLNEEDNAATDGTEKTVSFYLGKKYSDEYYCVAFEGDSRTYLMSAELVKKTFSPDFETLFNTKFATVDVTTVDALKVYTAGKCYEYSFEFGKTTDALGNILTELQRVFKDGEEIKEIKRFTDYYGQLAVMQWTDRITKNPETAGEELATLEFIRSSEEYLELKLTFESFEEGKVLVRRNGEAICAYSAAEFETFMNYLP